MPKAQSIAIGEVARLLADLVAIPSINPALVGLNDPPEWGGEKRLAGYVCEWLRQNGIQAELDEVLPGRPNVVARLPGPLGASRVIWEGHLDTVQVDGMTLPFDPVIRDGRLYGRGAVDDKASLAMFMLALRAARDLPRDCDVTFLAAIDEEVGFAGASHHIARNGRYAMGIAGEPTGLRIVTACKGCVRWVTEVYGRNAHASRPEEGVDAIAIAADLLIYLQHYMRDAHRHHAMLGTRTLTCTLLHAGEGPNSVPALATLTFDMRTLPDQSGPEAWKEIAAVVTRFPKPPGAAIEMLPPFIDSISMEVPCTAPVVGRLQAALRAGGLDPEPVGAPFGSDATKFTRAGSPTVVFGPGSIDQAHAREEYVDLADVARAAEILVATLARSGRLAEEQRPAGATGRASS
jgi:acetylornithine deacetylase